MGRRAGDRGRRAQDDRRGGDRIYRLVGPGDADQHAGQLRPAGMDAHSRWIPVAQRCASSGGIDRLAITRTAESCIRHRLNSAPGAPILERRSSMTVLKTVATGAVLHGLFTVTIPWVLFTHTATWPRLPIGPLRWI